MGSTRTVRGIRKWWGGLALLAAAVPAFGDLSITVTGVTQTQAVLQETGFTGDCTIQVSPSASLAPLHPDVDGTEYSGANRDTGRADTIVSADGSKRTVTIGHQIGDRALAAFSTYYYQVSGCGTTVSGSFTTANLGMGTTRTEQTPFDPSQWGNLGYPAFDWTQRKNYVDPMTGVTLKPLVTTIQTWRTGCGAAGCAPTSRTFADWAGGAGWSNASGMVRGAASNASTSTTNTLDLYADISGGADPTPYNLHQVLEDIGIVVWGGGTSATAADRVINVCLFLNPTAGCASNPIQITLPQGGMQQVRSTAVDADRAFPSSFPSSPFFGWTGSKSPLIRMENRETFGTLTMAGNTLTIPAVNAQQHFSTALTAGQQIFVQGSSCPNQLCTVAGTPSGPGSITVKETAGTGSAAFRAYGWGVRVWKDNPNGTVSVGLQYKLAGSNTPIGVQALGDKCSPVQVTSGDGKPGYLCSLTSTIAGFGWLAFIANDGTTRILSNRFGFSFDDQQGNVFYGGGKNSTGGWTIFKYTYTFDYTRELSYKYLCSSAGDCPPVNDGITQVDLMPHELGADLDQQIQAGQGKTLPAYNASIYGSWTASSNTISYAGSSGHFAFFCNTYSGQGQPNSGGPGWCASVDISKNPAQVVRLIHTLDGTGAPNARFGSLHSPQSVDSYPNTLFLSLDPVNSHNTATLHGGPFEAKVQSILMDDGVTWSADTCLDWPVGTGTKCAKQNYLRTCPANSAPYTECVTFRLPQGGVCNVAATAVEKTNWPCPWNSNYSQFPLMQVGDNAADMGAVGSFDSEHFHILSVAPDADNTLRVVAARNGTYDYCSLSPWHGRSNPMSVDAVNQFQHANGWTLTMMPGTVNTCGAAVLLQEQTTGSVQELGHSFAGHSHIGRAPNGVNFVTRNYTYFNTPFASLGKVPPVFNTTTDPSFHGNAAFIGNQLQSYTDNGQYGAGAAGHAWALDMNPLVGCPEAPACGGIARSLTSVGGNVYKIQTLGSAAASNTTYKVQPMIAFAGRYQLKDVSGPSSNVDAAPYSACFALISGECHAGSAANDVFVNVPAAYDPGSCTPSVSWANIPCVFFGDNAPGGGMRQFRISHGDSNGNYSRFISNGWSSMGRHYGYTHATTHPSGQWAMMMGTNLMDGYSMTGLLISLPPWVERSDPANDFKSVKVTIPGGQRYAEVQFGYSRYIGAGNAPNNGLYCTARNESCNTSAASLFNFESERRQLKSCLSGCTITIPAVAPNVMYYRVRRSNDGVNWAASDIETVMLP